MADSASKDTFALIGSVVAGILGIAVVATILGKNSQAPGVIQAAGSGLSSVIGAAVAPSSGGGTLSLPTAPTAAAVPQAPSLVQGIGAPTSQPLSLGSYLPSTGIGLPNGNSMFSSLTGSLY